MLKASRTMMDGRMECSQFCENGGMGVEVPKGDADKRRCFWNGGCGRVRNWNSGEERDSPKDGSEQRTCGISDLTLLPMDKHRERW